MKKAAFTLIELLVVMFIIATLMGIALPVFQRVIGRARSTQSLSNLRQIGTATLAYLNDNNDHMFPLASSGTSWEQRLNPQYIGVWKVFQSPFDQRAPSEVSPSPVSYGCNPNTLSTAGGGNSVNYHGYASDFNAASQLILFAEAPDGTGSGAPYIGQSTSNVLLAYPTTGGGFSGVFDGGELIDVCYADAHAAIVTYSTYSSGSGTASNIEWLPVN